jgi:urease accessory protein
MYELLRKKYDGATKSPHYSGGLFEKGSIPMTLRSSLPGFGAAALALLLPAAASAHVGAGHAAGLAHGFWHPVGGLDHVLAMVAVGLFAANLGGRALWAVPLAFIVAMAGGGVLGIEQIAIPYVEAGIALSVIALGALVALRVRWPIAAAMALVAVFAVFHGHAHGAEMPADASGLAYAAGFMIATIALHMTGVMLGTGLLRGAAVRTAQLGGSAIALAGVALLTGAL